MTVTLDKAAALTGDGELTYISFPIEKVEQTADGNVLVWGKATDDSVDSDNQIVDPDFAAKGIAEWLETGPNVRVQHQAQRDPAGVGVSMERDGNAHWVKSRVIEPVAKQLVLGGALRAYSVGIARPTIVRDSVARGGRITDGQIVEISLVDRPANKNCGIQLVKSAGSNALEWKAFGSDEILAKMGGQDVTLTLPQDVQVSFSPLDMAKIIGRKNGFIGKEGVRYDGGTPMGAKDAVRYDGGTTPTMKEDEPDEHPESCKCGTCSAKPDMEKGDLSTDARNALPDSDFALPGRRYPIHDKSHARNALARVSQHGTPEEKTKVRAAVARRYPKIGKKMVAKTALTAAQEALTKKDKAACASCGAMQNAAHGYCSECGSHMGGAIPVEKNHDFMCLKCGNELDKGEKHCPQCGAENPGYNPMADLKIPANKSTDGSRVAEEAEVQPDATEPDPILKAAKPKKKGKKGKPFGGSQAPPFGKDKDDDGDKDDAEKTNDAPVTKVKKGKKNKGGGFGHTPSPGEGVTGESTESVPAHREPDGATVESFERDAKLPTNKGKKLGGKESKAIPIDGTAPGRRGKTKKAKTPAMPAVPHAHDSKPVPGHRAADTNQEFDSSNKYDDPAEGAMMRLKSLGVPQDMGYAHDLVCPAFTWDDVSKAYPSGYGSFSADEWQQKALQAAASAPLAQAQSASRLGQAAFAIKSAAMDDLIDVKGDMFKAFKDANPGPGSFPTPGEICATHFRRPVITSGRSADSHQYGTPNNGPVPSGSAAASQFGRGFIHDGRATDSPANKGAPYPSETGQPVNLNYSSIHKDQILQAFKAMHDHFDRVFPGVCPMNDQGTAAHQFAAQKSDDGVVTKKVSADGMTKKQRNKMKKKLTKKVMSGKMPLDQARIKMGKKPKTSPEPLKPTKAIVAELVKSAPVITKKDFTAALKKSEKNSAKKIAALTKAVNMLADQPDPSTQAFKGMAVNPVRAKNAASPAGVQTVAEVAERTQAMMAHSLEDQWRNSTDSATREAAWNALLKMRGLPSGS